MTTDTQQIDESVFNSYLSFRPLVETLKKNIAEGNPGFRKLYGSVVEELESHPELLHRITDLSVIEPHAELIQELLSAVFPPTTPNNLYAVSLPFRFTTVYSSPQFKDIFIQAGSNEIHIPNEELGASLSLQKLQFACGMIMNKYAGYNSPSSTGWVHPYLDPQTGLLRYMELRVDARFIDVNPVGEMPKMDSTLIYHHTNRCKTIEELTEQVPVDKFVFEGLSVIRVVDVTEQEVITRIKNTLLEANAFSDSTVFPQLEAHIQSLIDMKDLKIGITPFFKVNGHYVYSDLHNNNSLLFKRFHNNQEKDEVSDGCKLVFRDNDHPVLFETLDEKALSEFEYLQYYYMEGGRSLIICPLKLHNELLGILEIMSESPGLLNHTHIGKIQPTITLFTLGLEKSMEGLDTQIDKIIKEQFTAVQPSVEWKFTEVALNYIVNKQHNEEVKIERIVFDEVFPLYGAIDIRNSSTERSHAIQLDIIEQLELANKVVKKALSDTPFALLQEVQFKIEKAIASASDVLQSDEERMIHDFLHGQVVSLFNHLSSTTPSVKNEVEHYFASLDPQIGMLYHHRKEYEQSISKINDTLARFIDREQVAAQKVYPHYFERYVTDGLEFNIYMGQSITPRRKFDDIYLKNLKMWQLSVIAKAAKITHHLEAHLTHPLRTTQLILVHSEPLAIKFRIEERKFDVDGAYNVRYEIVKKRIDKAHIKETNERLTQPGKIAIVYSQAKDAAEYVEYIEFLQNQRLLKPGIERHDLEELQGVVGMKALRVDVNFDHDPKAAAHVELSGTTTKQLIG